MSAYSGSLDQRLARSQNEPELSDIANELGREVWELVADEVLSHNAYGSYTHPETNVWQPGFSVVRERARTFKRPLEAGRY